MQILKFLLLALFLVLASCAATDEGDADMDMDMDMDMDVDGMGGLDYGDMGEEYGEMTAEDMMAMGYGGGGGGMGGGPQGDIHSANVVPLNFAAYKELVYEKKAKVFIKFYAPWCGHCQHMGPAYSALADSAESRGQKDIVIAAVDCTDNNDELCAYMNIEGFPTLKLVDGAAQKIYEYDEQRDLQSMIDFVSGEYVSATSSAFPETRGVIEHWVVEVKKFYSTVVEPIHSFNQVVLPLFFGLGALSSGLLIFLLRSIFGGKKKDTKGATPNPETPK